MVGVSVDRIPEAPRVTAKTPVGEKKASPKNAANRLGYFLKISGFFMLILFHAGLFLLMYKRKSPVVSCRVDLDLVRKMFKFGKTANESATNILESEEALISYRVIIDTPAVEGILTQDP